MRRLQHIVYSSSMEQSVLVRHPEFWFSDGSLVLRAGSTLFRIHVSQLCRKSVFFRDMFSLPQPLPADQEKEMIDDCPVLDLHDSPQDVAYLVKVIYDGPSFANNDRNDFVAVSGMLRLANKYLVEESIRSKVLEHIRVVWPSTLHEWDAREDIARMYETETGSMRGHRFPNPIAVINLAREIGAEELLAAAFYDLSRYSYAQILEPSPGDPLHPDSSPTTTSLAHTLSPGDMQRLALGKETAQHAINTLIQNMEYASPDTSHHRLMHQRTRSATNSRHSRSASATLAAGPCITPAACRKDLCELVELAKQHYLMDRERGCADPLYVAEELGQLKSAEFSDCGACARDLETWAARERERLWKAIPDWFRLR
ncbi:hypothetical protein C8Q70DRAFT_1000191 [Cubamyces menziesii]|uniref:BTB domain-containing protein n=1 Tax=Trametes cubensis TaxID=1111947 RepID=A0AAD7X750_9APHY|nr:hypothetical protein C8Q70DRAFT_1000191 [Cubamyces menziesii]KAJ8463780.1 hypothetical protein ONZ51_g10029 [Trametes cubensis]